MAKTQPLESAIKAQKQIAEERERILAVARVDVEAEWQRKFKIADAETKRNNQIAKDRAEAQRRVDAELAVEKERQKNREEKKAMKRMEMPTPEQTEKAIEHAKEQYERQQKPIPKGKPSTLKEWSGVIMEKPAKKITKLKKGRTKQRQLVKPSDIGTIPKPRKTLRARNPQKALKESSLFEITI